MSAPKTRAAHLSRPPEKARGRRQLPLPELRPGYYLAPVLRWWPNWQPYVLPGDVPRKGRPPGDAEQSRRAAESRRRAQESGVGWGKGTVLMPGTPANDAPGWL